MDNKAEIVDTEVEICGGNYFASYTFSRFC